MDGLTLKLMKGSEVLSNEAKLKVLKISLVYLGGLSPQEADTFLTPAENLANPDTIIAYSTIERKVARAYSSVVGAWNPEVKSNYLREMGEALQGFCSQDEIREMGSNLVWLGDASLVSFWLAGDHYGMRRIRNAYIPESMDLIEIDVETGKGTDLTKHFFKEGPEDAVSRLDKLLGK